MERVEEDSGRCGRGLEREDREGRMQGKGETVTGRDSAHVSILRPEKKKRGHTWRTR